VKKSRNLYLVVLALIAVGIWWFLKNRAASPSVADNRAEVTSPEDSSPPNRRVVVDFIDNEDHRRIAALGRKLGVTFAPSSSQFDVDEIYLADAGDETAAAKLLAILRARDDVEAADYDVDYAIPEEAMADEVDAEDVDTTERGFPNDPRFAHQWHLDQIHVKEAWKLSQGRGVTVAVIDTGVAKVPDLAETELVPGFNFVTNNADATDDHGHGTHVAGTIAQSTNNGVGVSGIAFGAKIMPIKVLSARGSGSVSGIAEGIRFAADHGAKVINMSLGGPMASSVLKNAVKYAHDKGVVVVCAAGNDGRGKVSYPAAYAAAFAVASTQFDETTAFYSNWGKEIAIATPGGNTRVDQNNDGMPDGVLQNTIVPGDIKRNDYLWFMGTSMASPHLAGVAALVISAGVTNPDAVEKILKETARAPKMAPKDKENRYGAGIIDAAAAVKKARQVSGKVAVLDAEVPVASGCQLTGGLIELGFAFGAMGLLVLGLRRRGLGLAGFGALVLGSSGLFFLRSFGMVPDFVSHGIPAWASSSLWLNSVALPLGAALLVGLRLPRLVAGLSLGVAGYLLAHALAPACAGATGLSFLWLTANAAGSFVLAALLQPRKL